MPVRLASIVHAFNYRVAVLWDGAKPALQTARSRRAERGFLNDVSLPWGQQVAVMFQILCALVLDVPAAAECLTNFQGASPNVLLAFEPWGRVDHMGVECRSRSSDRTGAYDHAITVGHSTIIREPTSGAPGLPGKPVLLLTWTHVLCLFLWCSLCVLVVSWFGPTSRLGSPVFLCRTSRYHIVHFTMYNSYGDGSCRPLLMVLLVCGLGMILIVCGLRMIRKWILRWGWIRCGSGHVDYAGRVRSSCFWLPGTGGSGAAGWFLEHVRVLVPDATPTPVGFHDVMIENLSNTTDYRARLVSARDIT